MESAVLTLGSGGRIPNARLLLDPWRDSGRFDLSGATQPFLAVSTRPVTDPVTDSQAANDGVQSVPRPSYPAFVPVARLTRRGLSSYALTGCRSASHCLRP